MFTRLLFPGLLLLVLPLGAEASTNLLAGYEPDETGDLTVTWPRDPGMTCTWVKCGEDGVPLCPQGSYCLKCEWTGETDHKVDIKHEWAPPSFDITDFILVDVYIATASALPDIIGIWDEGPPTGWFGWKSAACVPPLIGYWYTVPIYVGEANGVDRIEALIFEDMPGTSGTIYIDNLRFGKPFGTCDRMIRFSNYWWTVLRSDYPIGAGPNCFTGDPDDVFVDENGHLHLSVVRKDGEVCEWYSSELISQDSFGYGEYAYTLQNNIDWDNNIILGLFTYDVAPAYSHREIDIEFNPHLENILGCPCEPGNCQYAIQPVDGDRCPLHPCDENLYRFDTDPPAPTTHVMTWAPPSVNFKSYHGEYSLDPDPDDLIDTWTYTGPDKPPHGAENVRMNFYLRDGVPPLNNQDAEIVISDFRYSPFPIPALSRFGLLLMGTILLAAGSFALLRRKIRRARGGT